MNGFCVTFAMAGQDGGLVMDETRDDGMIPLIYVNAVRFATSLHDFSMFIGVVEPTADPEKAKTPTTTIRFGARLVMSPTHFKKFLEIANGVLSSYEERFGKISTEPRDADSKPGN